MQPPPFAPDISREDVAAAAGGDLAYLAAGEHKDEAMQTMATGLAVVVRRLFEQGKLDGIMGMGGGGNTSIATTAMRSLPVGVPKLMLSTFGGGDVSGWAGTKDITFMPSVVDVSGLNSISRKIYANAAGAICGTVKMAAPPRAEENPLITASMFGNTTTCVNRAKVAIEVAGDYEVLVFHTNGAGGKTMEGLIGDGFIVGCLDITTTELADEVCGGVLSAGPERCLAAAKSGIPTVLVPGCVDMANFWGVDTLPERYQNRQLYKWNPSVTLLRTNVEENIKIGELIAAAANASIGPVAIALPLQGVSMLDRPNGEFWDPEADQACFDAIRSGLNPTITIHELDLNINDPAFADAGAGLLVGMLELSRKDKGRIYNQQN